MTTASASLTPFLNREGDFDPAGWFMLVPKGEFPITRLEGANDQKKPVRYLQVVDDVALEKIAANFNRRLAADPSYLLLIDFEHFSHQSEKKSEAACWVGEVERRANGVFARGRWTDAGEAAVKNRRYRYLSPVWFPPQTEPLGGNRFRPVEVADAGLTNKPNLGAAFEPFWNRAPDDTIPVQPDETPTQKTEIMKEKLLALLALDAAATDEQIVAAITALKDKAAKADEAVTDKAAITNRLNDLETKHKALLGDAVTKELNANADVIPEADQAAWKNRLESDFTGTATLLRNLKRPEAHKPVHKPGAAAAAAKKGGADDDKHPFLNRVAEYATANKCDEADAAGIVATKEPALYQSYRDSLLGGE